MLEDRTLPSGLAGVGAVGDSYTVEYQFIPGRDAARNWLEQLAEYRGVNFGAFQTTPWDAIRGPGYEYNWAVGSAANYTAQVSGLDSQIASGQVTTAVIMGSLAAETDPADPSTGDPGNPSTIFTYLNEIYNGTLTGSALSTVLAANVASRIDTLDAFQAAGQQSGSGVDVVMANYGNFAVVPQLRQALPDPVGRQNIVNADTQLNAQLEAAANARGIPVLDVFGLSQYIDQLTSSGQSLVLGGHAMDMTDYTPSSQEFAGTPVVPQDLWADQQHLGSVGQGLIANMFITAVDKAYGAGIPLFSDQEILQNAWQTAGLTPPPMTAGPTYFDVSRWVIFPTPTLTSLSVNSALVGAPDQTITVTGKNFLTSSVVDWNGTALPTTFVNNTTLIATIPVADLTKIGTNQVTVVNPTPGGGPSNAVAFNVYAHFSGFAPPASPDKVFQAGQTVPLKFQLTNYSGQPVTDLASQLVLQSVAVDAQGNPLPGATPQPLASAGKTSLRWDSAANQYVFNWQTEGLAPGSYKILFSLSDGTSAITPAQQPTLQFSSPPVAIPRASQQSSPLDLLEQDLAMLTSLLQADVQTLDALFAAGVETWLRDALVLGVA